MKFLKVFILNIIWFYTLSLTMYAHETEEVHEEPPANIDTGIALGIIIVVLIIGFIVWKFVLTKKESPPMKSG